MWRRGCTVACFLALLAAASFSSPTTPFMVSAIAQHYHTGCVLLATSQPPGACLECDHSLSSVQKMAGFPTATARLPHANLLDLARLCRRNRPLVVLFGPASAAHVLTQVSRGFPLSAVTWLLLPPSSSDTSLADVPVPFDCEFLVAKENNCTVDVAELYSVGDNRTLVSVPWGSWNASYGLAATSLSLYRRRNDLQGIRLRAAALPAEPVTILREGKVGGLSGMIWECLQEELNFSLQVVVPEDSTFGRPEGGHWTGLLGMLEGGVADVAANCLQPSSLRESVVYFTQPVVDVRNQVFIKEPQEHARTWDSYVHPFKPFLWLAVALSVLAVSTLLLAVHVVGFSLGFPDSLPSFTGLYLQQGMWVIPRSLSGRVLCLTALLSSLILMAAYSARLIAHLSIREAVILPFSSFEDLLKGAEYAFGVAEGSAQHEVFASATHGTLSQVHRRLLSRGNSLTKNHREGLRRACRERFAFAAPDVLVRPGMTSVGCPLTDIPAMELPGSHIAVPVAVDSPYRRAIAYSLEKLRETGILKKIRLGLWPAQESLGNISLEQVNLWDVTPVLLLLLLAFPLSGLCLLLELQRSRKTGRARVMTPPRPFLA